MNYDKTDLKFRIEEHFENLLDNDFTIEIKNRWGKLFRTITKDDSFKDSDNNYYFCLEEVPTGVYYAHFFGSVSDYDFLKREMVISDIQHLTTVGACQCNKSDACGCEGEHKVNYTQVWTVDVDGNIYLVDSDGVYLLDSEGQRIIFKNK